MENLIPLSVLLLSCGFCFSQQRDCPKGYSWMPSIYTSSLTIKADTCLPDSTSKKLWLEFSKNMCGESSYVGMSGNYSHSSIGKWINDNAGCKTIETFEKRVKGKWISITKRQYYEESKCCKCYTLGKNNKQIEKPCWLTK